MNNKFNTNKKEIKVAQVLQITEFDENVLADWKTLWDKADNSTFYNSPMWFSALQRTYSFKRVLIVRFLDKADETIGIVPFVRESVFGVSLWVTPLSNEPILLARKNKTVLKQIFRELYKIDNLVLFELKQEDTEDLDKSKAVCVSTSSRPYIDVSEVRERLMSKSFKKIRTRLRNIGSQLGYSFQAANPEDLRIISKIEKHSHKVDSCTDVFSKDTTSKLYSNLIDLAKDNVYVGYMHDGKKPIVSDFYLYGGETAHSTHTSYRKEYTRHWPGNLLQYRVLETFMDEGKIKEVDLGRGVNYLKLKYATGVRVYSTAYLVSNRFKRFYLKTLTTLKVNAYSVKESSRLLTSGVIAFKKLNKR